MTTRTWSDGRKIVTEYWPKPIPTRGADWCALLEDYDGAPDAEFQPKGYGASEQEAIDDLLQWDEDASVSEKEEA